MSYSFEGDLYQMGSQFSLLRNYDFQVYMDGVYPRIDSKEEYYKAIRLIWTFKCEGWWHYRDILINELKECTRYEFYKNLGRDRTVKLYHFVDRKNIWNENVKLNGKVTKNEDEILKIGDEIELNGEIITVA